jgi:sulfite reductase (ferredoxin)
MTAQGWKERLSERIPSELAREIDIFERQIELRKQGKIDEALFAETRLRRGAYGQRYDNGQRHDGIEARQLTFGADTPTKGPNTVWDAPGMQRIKIPWGGLTPEQMDVLADCSEEYADAISHITTRQDVQLHFVHIDDTPTLMRRLAAVGITTREACGNTVRNVTACQLAGVCQDETFDVTPYADALTHYLLGHDDTQDFGRKFKIAFSGCKDKACGLTTIHDLGFIAALRDGKRGFEMVVGGGLGSVPFTAQPFSDFVAEEELLPLSLAVCRVFARLGEKRNRARARLKFVVAKLGIDEFRRVVLEERAALRDDPRWTSFLPDVARAAENPLIPASSLVRHAGASETAFDRWRASNVVPQRQAGFATATVTLPLGDISARQLRALADVARRFNGGTVRTTVEQNIVLRWISEKDLPAVHQALCEIGLGAPGAGTIVDVVACPGTDTCKLGIASSRGLAAELSHRLAAREHHPAVRGLRIKASGCFNSCGQHHIADIGFWGVSRKVGSYTVPHFQAVLGGQWTENAKSYGLAMGALPSKNIPAVVDRLTDAFAKQRSPDESFQDWIRRVGKKAVRDLLEDLFTVPAHDQDPSFYSDWSDPREFTIGDLGVGECAGEVVSYAQFGLSASEREVFEAQELLERGDAPAASDRALQAMLQAAKALVKQLAPNVSDDSDEIVREFRAHLYDTKKFWDTYAGGKFAQYLFLAHEHKERIADADGARRRIEEASLFIEAAHSCYQKLSASGSA